MHRGDNILWKWIFFNKNKKRKIESHFDEASKRVNCLTSVQCNDDYISHVRIWAYRYYFILMSVPLIPYQSRTWHVSFSNYNLRVNLLDIEKIKTFIFPSNLRATFSSIFSSMTFLSYPFTKYLPYILGYILPLQSLNFLGDGAHAHFYHHGGHFVVRILSLKKKFRLH